MIATLLFAVWGRVWQYALAAGAVLGLLLGIYVKGRSDAEASVEAAAEKQRAQDLDKAKKISNEVDQMPASDVDAGLSKFMRND